MEGPATSLRVPPAASLCRPNNICRATSGRLLQRRKCFVPVALQSAAQGCRQMALRAADTEAQQSEEASEEKGGEIENPDSESARKAQEAERLRAAEKFMVVGTGEALCKGCGYEYSPAKGDPEYPVSPNTLFQDLPRDWQCPICGAGKIAFENKARTIAGFAENQAYGFGTNSMTSGQKSILIFGSLLLFFFLFLAGYLFQ